MAKTAKRITSIACPLIVFFLSACASQQPRETAAADEYGMFTEGQSEATFATAFPVASPAEAFRNGDAAMKAGELDRALFEYIRGLRISDEPSADTLYKVGGIHHARSNLRLAVQGYRWALQIDPLHVEAGSGLGLVLLEQQQYEAAREQLEVVVSSGRASWRAYNALGIIADMEENNELAAEHYREALARNPASPQVLNNLGYSRYLAGDWDGASSALQKALRQDNGYELAWRNLGLVYARQKKYDMALEALRRTVDESEAYNDIGFVAMMEGEYGRALNFFETAMRLSPAFYVTASENAENVRRMLDRARAGNQEL